MLAILLSGIVALNIYLEKFYTPSREPEDMEAVRREYEEFLSSLKQNKPDRNEYSAYTSPKEQKAAELFFFDPNTIDSAGLSRLGMRKFVAGNIINYRRKGGFFHRPEDLKKIYGLGNDEYVSLLPYIRIEARATATARKDTTRTYAEINTPDTFEIRKYPKGTVIDLNTAGAEELTKIPGIGKGIAGKIMTYRQQLGGFYELRQLGEIGLNVDTFSVWMTVVEGQTARMNLNRVSIERLKSHPYFNFYQAKVIVEYRKKKGTLKDLKQLSLYEEFTEEDFQRISHYVSF